MTNDELVTHTNHKRHAIQVAEALDELRDRDPVTGLLLTRYITSLRAENARYRAQRSDPKGAI